MNERDKDALCDAFDVLQRSDDGYCRAGERDSLTGLYTRSEAEELIRKALGERNETSRVGALLIVDLDDFKRVNDLMGHSYGDAILSEAARKLQSMYRGYDIAGRYKEDAFILYLKDLPDGETACRKGQQICQMFRDYFSETETDYRITVSIGISLFSEQAATLEELYEKAAAALCQAKTEGKDTWRLYEDETQRCQGTREQAMVDNSAEMTFSENVAGYVFRILHESDDLGRAVRGVLELVCRHFSFDHGYVFEADDEALICENMAEWCGPGQPPFPAELKKLEGKPLQLLLRQFNTEGYHIVNSGEKMPLEENIGMGEVSLRLECAFMESGRFQGFLGFARLRGPGTLNGKELATLRGVAKILDIFLAEKHQMDKLVESGMMLQAIADSLQSCTYIIDPKTYMLHFVNQNTSSIIPEARIGTFCYETIRGRSKPCEDCPIGKMVQGGMREYQTEMYLDRYQLWAKINAALIRRADGQDYGLFNGYDFAQYKKQNGHFMVGPDAFTRDVSLFHSLSNSTDDYIFMCDMTKNLFYFPEEMVEEFDLPGQIIENAIPIWAEYIHEYDRQGFLQDIDNMIAGRTNLHNQEYRVKNKEGSWIWVWCRGYLERDEDGQPTNFSGVIKNLGQKNKIDHMTGLPVKYEFEAKVRERLDGGAQRGALAILGIDNFKYINNLYGREFGDEVMRETAQRLQEVLPGHIQLYRLDGDWFGFFAEGDDTDLVEYYYGRMLLLLQQRRAFREYNYRCTISGGYASFDGEGASYAKLLTQAEYALEYSKMEGKRCMNCYRDERMSSKERSVALIASLHDCIEQDFEGFELYFQPQVAPENCSVRSAEALLRWNCPGFGAIPPDEFVPLLEQTGLIHPVGNWVLLQAAQMSRKWRQVRPDFTVSVNLSYMQLQDKSFLPYLSTLVEQGTLKPEELHLELTESCVASGRDALSDSFEKLRTLGFCIEMDDFGTGYSSLEILKNAPADVVKIDHAFVRDITRCEFDAALIQFVVSLCHSVGIKVCLEGVETWAEYYRVEPMGLDLIQGFLFGRPQNCGEFEKHYLS